MDQAQCVNKLIAQVFTEVTITKRIHFELLPVRQCRVSRARQRRPVRQAFIAQQLPSRTGQALAAFTPVNPLYRFRSGHALGVAAKTGTNVPP
jgi:hypothetical protein